MTILVVIATIAFITSITGVMMHDFYIIRVERAYRRHPHARKWRQRPVVTVVGADDTSALRRTYRKLRLSPAAAADGLTLHLPHAAMLPPRSLPQATHFFALYPKKSLALLPVITTPTTTGSFFGRPICCLLHRLHSCVADSHWRLIVIFPLSPTLWYVATDSLPPHGLSV